MPTIHEIAAFARSALRNGRPLTTLHNPTGTILAVWGGQLPANGDEKMPHELIPTGPLARVLSLSFFDPRTRAAMTLDPARSLTWLELVFGEDRRHALVGREDPARVNRREVWNFYVCYRKGEAFMPVYTEAMSNAGIVPYITLEPQFVLAREAIREARKTT